MLRNYINKLYTSLTIRIFFITAVILAAACGVTYGFIAFATPISYTSLLTNELKEQATELVKALENTTKEFYDEEIIISFETQTGANVDILEDVNFSSSDYTIQTSEILTEGSVFSVAEPHYENPIGVVMEDSVMSDTTLSYTFSFLDSTTENMLSITGNVQAVNQTQTAIRQVFPYLLVIILLIALIGALFYSRYITKPVVHLSGISQKIADLDFTWKYSEKRKDEIGLLGRNLNTLSRRLSSALNELRVSNHALRRDIDHERDLEQQRITFFSAASHELKTPITILKGQLSGMLADVDVYKDRDKYLARSLTVANRMQTLVQEILTVTRMENTEFVMKQETINLSSMLTELTNQAADLAEQRNQTLTVEITPSKNICGDEMLLKRAISNLLSNALIHSPEGATILVCLKTVDTNLLLMIDNSGVSISDTALPHLFEAFYRVDASRSRETGGSGLGLYLVQMILKRHNTICTIENTQYGVRTMVTFSIL